MTSESVEIRCPVGPRRLFAKVISETGEAPHTTPDNLMEFACSDCKKRLQQRDPTITRVLHRYNFFGELVQSISEH